jgi:hypothetical protein
MGILKPMWRRQMGHRFLIAAGGSVAVVIATVSQAGISVAGQAPSPPATFTVPRSTYAPPKTPWGDPDLEGTYDNRGGVPMERPAALAGKKTFTDAEMAARRRGAGGGGGDLCAPWKKDDAACKNASVERLDNVGGYNSFWGEGQGQVEDNRTSLIEDPVDGKIPPMTPQALAVQQAYLKVRGPIAQDTGSDDNYGRVTVYKHWLDFDILGRCIAAQTPTGSIPYNSARSIMQSPGWVMIAFERLNTRVIPLDGRPHLGQNIRSWQGDSRGHWEGNTLVVETTNFTNKQSGGGVGSSVRPGIPFGNIRLVERFVPVGPKRINYYATLEDSKTWTRPWTFMQPWQKDITYVDVRGKAAPYEMYEYACREGDRGVENSLRGTMVEAERAKNTPRVAASALVTTLIGGTEATVREKLGKPAAILGPRWEYHTTQFGGLFYVYFKDSKVASVTPNDIGFEQVAKTP